jgi:hypothetical protein
VAALLAADHARLGEGQSAHVDHYRGIKGEDQAALLFLPVRFPGTDLREPKGAPQIPPLINIKVMVAESWPA